MPETFGQFENKLVGIDKREAQPEKQWRTSVSSLHLLNKSSGIYFKLLQFLKAHPLHLTEDNDPVLSEAIVSRIDSSY